MSSGNVGVLRSQAGSKGASWLPIDSEREVMDHFMPGTRLGAGNAAAGLICMIIHSPAAIGVQAGESRHSPLSA